MSTLRASDSPGGIPNAGKGIIIGLLSALGSAVLVGLLFAVIYFFRCTSSGRILLDRLGRPGEYDDEQAFLREEAEALERMDEVSRSEYLRAKAFVEANPPDSIQTDISLSQYLAIQEKGVSAWEFEAELEVANCFVQARTEVEFYDSECAFSVQSNLPLPKHNEVYYWEAKMFELPENTVVAVGLATKPYPLFRLPGFHKHSVSYLTNGQKHLSNPFHSTPYGPSFQQGDVIGCGYRPRSGTIFFTRNGKKLEDAAHHWKSFNLFPTIGATGPAKVHVNLGQSGFVFIEANVKRWGLAPASGTLAPPPPYGSESGSILLESAGAAGATSAGEGHEGDGYFGSVVYQGAHHAGHAYPPRISSRNNHRPIPHQQQQHNIPPPPSYSSTSPAQQQQASNRSRTNTATSNTASRTRDRSNTATSTRPRATSFLNATRPPAYHHANNNITNNNTPLSPGPARSPTDISLAPLNSDGSNSGRTTGDREREGSVNREFGGPPPEYDSGSESDEGEGGRLLGAQR